MLDYNLLASKPIIEIPNRDTTSKEKFIRCKDLCVPSISPNAVVATYKVVYVTEPYIARPDLISLAVYGSDEYADVICKVNGISNPFELNAGMELIIPAFESILTFFKQRRRSSTILDSDEISKVIKNNQKAKNESRSPAQQTIGDKNFVIDKTNRIVYY